MKSKEGETFDKKQMALAIRNSTYDDSLGCSLLEEGIIKSCDVCNLNCVCELINEGIGSRIYEMCKDYVVEIEKDARNNYRLK
ncbi:hypothetical protein GKZ28_06855 [Clostridium chromiireducens]|uniref:Uncharacterized protein n=1 Tax=Clostridium chromiireducens TaxID=225345 RepID=A0A964W1T9_9CLOT|nr:hypothetical protein [Clostridium chromiireducens]MVX63412.1 hypothetical protein [Clostridium chromiireducens]